MRTAMTNPYCLEPAEIVVVDIDDDVQEILHIACETRGFARHVDGGAE
jgi:hypothetical protein